VIVPEQQAGHGITGRVDIGPAVVVQVCRHRCEPLPFRAEMSALSETSVKMPSQLL
jgi:hypothetical protein